MTTRIFKLTVAILGALLAAAEPALSQSPQLEHLRANIRDSFSRGDYTNGVKQAEEALKAAELELTRTPDRS